MSLAQPAPRPSFLDRQKQLALATPKDLHSSVKVTLWTLFMFAHDDGGSIYVSSETLMDMTGLTHGALFRCLKVLTDRGYLLDDGWKQHGTGCRTRLRRIDLGALQRDRGVNVAAGVAEDPENDPSPTHGTNSGCDTSPTHGTLPADPSPTHGTTPSPTHGTQTKSLNQEKKEDPSLREGAAAPARAVSVIPSMPISAPVEAIAPPSIRQSLFRDGVPILRALIGKSESATRSLLGSLLRAADDDAARVYSLIREAETLQPADPGAWLFAAAKRGGRPMARGQTMRESHGTRLRKQLGLETSLDQIFADRAASGGLLS